MRGAISDGRPYRDNWTETIPFGTICKVKAKDLSQHSLSRCGKSAATVSAHAAVSRISAGIPSRNPMVSTRQSSVSGWPVSSAQNRRKRFSLTYSLSLGGYDVSRLFRFLLNIAKQAGEEYTLLPRGNVCAGTRWLPYWA